MFWANPFFLTNLVLMSPQDVCYRKGFGQNAHSLEAFLLSGETVETMSDFVFLGSKITADGDFSHEIKRCLLLGRKVMTNLDSILKRRHIVNKVPSSQGYGFSSGHVWM